MTLLCAGLACAWYAVGVGDNLVQLETALALGGICLGGSVGLLVGRPMRGLVVGLVAVPVVGTLTVFAIAYFVMAHVRF